MTHNSDSGHNKIRVFLPILRNKSSKIFLPIFYRFNGLVNWSWMIYDIIFSSFFSFRPLQFSFLGQIYKTKSSSGMSSSSSSKKQRRCASQKVTTSTSSSRNHVLESSNEDFTLNSDSAKNLSTQVILENWLYSASKKLPKYSNLLWKQNWEK